MKVRYDNGHSPFKAALDRKVRAYLGSQPSGRFASARTKVKCACIFICMCMVYYWLILASALPGLLFGLPVVLGVLQVMLVFNVGHDASHGSFSPRRWVNSILRYSWDITGVSSYSWALRHNIAHHGFTNVIGMDLDIEQGGLIRLTSASPCRVYHRWQHIYAPFVYGLFTLYLVTVRDFQILRKKQFGNVRIVRHGARAWVEVVMGKVIYLCLAFVVPCFIAEMSMAGVVAGFCAMHLTAGFVVMTVLAPTHLSTGAMLVHAVNGALPHGFAEHQLYATADMAAGSRLFTGFCGGLNAHVIHHLYPGVSHSHYHGLTAILRDTADEYGLPYRSRSVLEGVCAHLAYLKELGKH